MDKKKKGQAKVTEITDETMQNMLENVEELFDLMDEDYAFGKNAIDTSTNPLSTELFKEEEEKFDPKGYQFVQASKVLRLSMENALYTARILHSCNPNIINLAQIVSQLEKYQKEYDKFNYKKMIDVLEKIHKISKYILEHQEKIQKQEKFNKENVAANSFKYLEL